MLFNNKKAPYKGIALRNSSKDGLSKALNSVEDSIASKTQMEKSRQKILSNLSETRYHQKHKKRAFNKNFAQEIESPPRKQYIPENEAFLVYQTTKNDENPKKSNMKKLEDIANLKSWLNKMPNEEVHKMSNTTIKELIELKSQIHKKLCISEYYKMLN